ncbi:unnamed protein product [Rotaria sp. Silwood1]|nr:unnamed protein product [Rotaria sp. Silwood1]
MTDFCRETYYDNRSQLRLINEFKDTFNESNALWWYTRDSFLYRLVNKALRMLDVDALYSIRYCLPIINGEIERHHTKWLRSHSDLKIFSVYRGYGTSTDDFKKLQTEIGGFMSISSFLSTSADRMSAYGFAFPLVGQPEQVAVLLEIEIDTENCHVSFVDLEAFSQIQEEKEILFSMGTVFRIQEIQEDSQGIWIVKVSLTGEEDEELKRITKHMREEIMDSTPMMSLIRLMLKMAKYENAEKYCLQLFDNSTVIDDSKSILAIYHILEFVYEKMHQESGSDPVSKGPLEIDVKNLSSAHPSIAHIYNKLGAICYEYRQHAKALAYFRKAINIQLNGAAQSDQMGLAMFYTNVGFVYNSKKSHSVALKMYVKALKIRLNILPANHPDIAQSYINIANLYLQQEEYNKAIDYLNKILEIQKISLPPYHPNIGETYEKLSKAFNRQNKLDKALHYRKLSYEINSKCFPRDHQRVIYDDMSIADIERRRKPQHMDETFCPVGLFNLTEQYLQHQKDVAFRQYMQGKGLGILNPERLAQIGEDFDKNFTEDETNFKN